MTGDKISIDDTVIIQAGNGMRNSSDVIDYVDPVYPGHGTSEEDDEDGFEEVTEPAAESEETKGHPQEAKTINAGKPEPTAQQKKEPAATKKNEPAAQKTPKSTQK